VGTHGGERLAVGLAPAGQDQPGSFQHRHASLRVHATRAARSRPTISRALGAVRLPAASNFCPATAIRTSGRVSVWQLSEGSRRRRCWWARAVPTVLTEAPIRATGLASQALSPKGREAQSMAFLRTPGTE